MTTKSRVHAALHPICLAALAVVAANGPLAAAQPPALRAGVSVDMPKTSHAVPMPDADKQDSFIVAVTAKGDVYFGITPAGPADWSAKIKSGLAGRLEKKLYIKGDSRTAYAVVARVLEAVRKEGVEAPNLLTAQRDSPEPVYPVPPKGLEVFVGPPLPSASESIAVQALHEGQQAALKINGKRISLESLPAALTRLFRNTSLKQVALRSDELLRFGDVVRVIDACRSTGAKLFLATSGM